MNSISLVGHVGKDPIVKLIEGTDDKVVKFSVAVPRYSPNKEDKKPMWVDVDAWNGVGERVLKTLCKGRQVALEGRLAINTFEAKVNGVMVELTKPVIKLTGFTACGPKPEALNASPADNSADEVSFRDSDDETSQVFAEEPSEYSTAQPSRKSRKTTAA